MATLRYVDQDWTWQGEAIGLGEPESALLGAMLRERGTQRRPHVWFALGLGRPYGPASGEAFLYSLMHKLSWAGAPSDLIRANALLGAMIAEDVAVLDNDTLDEDKLDDGPSDASAPTDDAIKGVDAGTRLAVAV